MIYYFSGTGNSKFVAEQLAKYTKDTALFIPQVMRSLKENIVVSEDETIGLVFPIYGWMVPQIVTEFLEHVSVDHKAYAYVVCTCGSETGLALRELAKTFPFKSAYSIKMPDNYIPMFDIDRPELIKEKINVAIQRIPKIALEVSAKSQSFEIEEGPLASVKTKVFGTLFAGFGMNPAKFSVDDTCVGCGQCVENCPFETIKLVDGKPVWSGRCQMCMSCIMKCPKKAIQYGSGTRLRGRYVFPDPSTKTAQPKPLSQAEQLAQVPHAAPAPVQFEFRAGTVVRPSTDYDFLEAADVQYVSDPGIVYKMISSENVNDSFTVSEVHLQPGTMQAFHPGTASVVWYALSGTSRLILSATEEKKFCAGDAVRFTGGAVHGLRNDGAVEFVYIAVKSK